MNEILQLPVRTPWHGLPGDYYRNAAVYDRELEQIWYAGWLFACPACELPERGDFITMSVDRASILLMRSERGIQAFHNQCPHRGSQLIDVAAGRAATLIVCPYHQWSFTRNGELHACRGMHECDRSTLGLRPVSTMTVCGLVFVCLANQPPDSGPLERMFAAAEPHGFETAKVAKTIDYEV